MRNDRRGVKEGARKALRARLERALETYRSGATDSTSAVNLHDSGQPSEILIRY